MPQHPSFLDVTLDRRLRMLERIERAAASLQVNIEEVRKETIKKLQEMRVFADASGVIIRNDASERAIQQQLVDLDAFMLREEGRAVEKLFAQREAAFIASASSVKFAVETATAGRAVISTSFSQIFEEAARVSKNSTVLGLNPKTTMRGTFADQKRRARDILTNSIIKGESIPDTARKINEASGIGRRAATRVARTNLTASTAEADRMLYDSDPDVFAGYKWDATFDSRTSMICANLHGRFYPLGSIPPGPPAHWNCRSTLEPVFKDEDVEKFAKQGGRRVRGFKKDGEQSKRDTIVDGEKTFQAWMREQPSPVTQRITGSKLKNSLFRSGKANLQDLTGDDLLARSDSDVVRRILARRPNDKQIRDLADELGVRRVKLGTIEREDRRIQREVRHTIGQRPRSPRLERERIARIDKLKTKKTRDVVRGAARRVLAEKD